jgi:hypothetical protein
MTSARAAFGIRLKNVGCHPHNLEDVGVRDAILYKLIH